MTAGAPPELPGFAFIETIGTGGFADVHLYQQALPSRRVAVKVLRESSDQAGRAQFHAEVNVMAQLSGHPSIVPIYQADVAADGRAFLVMEYCPPPHIAQRYRVERIGVSEVLDTGVKIASAVETAHRVGILHRDVKPHNILTSSFGAPMLTDFGIAAVAGHDSGGNYALSVPWSPPEAFGDSVPFDVRSDVFALAATIYSLLAGRSPFEVPGAANDSATLIHRIENQAPSRVLRPDVPDSLNALLARALSRAMADRPTSAMALARGFQEVQIELGMAPTRLEVIDASPEAATADREVADERTLVRPVQIIVPDEILEQGTLLRPRRVEPSNDRTTRVPPRGQAVADTVYKPTSTASAAPGSTAELTGPDGAPGSGVRLGPILVGAGLALVLVGGVVAALLFGAGTDPEEALPTAPPPVVLPGGPAVPVDLQVERQDEEVLVSWRNPSPESGDAFQLRTGPTIGELQEVYRGEQEEYAVEAEPGEQLCIAVATIRESAISEALTECIVLP